MKPIDGSNRLMRVLRYWPSLVSNACEIVNSCHVALKGNLIY